MKAADIRIFCYVFLFAKTSSVTFFHIFFVLGENFLLRWIGILKSNIFLEKRQKNKESV